jgi:o-succinylbenzoate synthase
MMITSCEAFFFDLPLVTPFQFSKQNLLSRTGIIISCSDRDQHLGYGEIAPLPGLHKENLESVLSQYMAIKYELINRELSDDLWQLDGCFESWLGKYNLFPSLRYGIEMAILNLLACQKSCSLASLLTSTYPKFLPISGLFIPQQGDDSYAHLHELSALGFTTVKLKVGRRSLQEEINTVQTATQILGDGVSLRLDCNRSWDFETAVKFAKAVTDYNIEYIEEPLADSAHLSAFHAVTKIPIALDESLIYQDPWSMVVPHYVGALVLKPALLGGFEHTKAFVSLANSYGIKTVISSVFDSGVGIAALANCAASLVGSANAAGLDTYRWLRDDLLVERFAVSRASLDVDRVHRLAQQLRSDLLTAVR